LAEYEWDWKDLDTDSNTGFSAKATADVAVGYYGRTFWYPIFGRDKWVVNPQGFAEVAYHAKSTTHINNYELSFKLDVTALRWTVLDLMGMWDFDYWRDVCGGA